ncbi:MAG: type IX secretion system sortase PorU [Gracilimonas sp.]|nr:type IX secretion system sortase PorU [Gracilimonas sp.]
MLNKLLIFSGLLCLFFAGTAQARQLKVVAETNSFTDYEFVNKDHKLIPAIGITISASGISSPYQILEQNIVSVKETISSDKALVLNLQRTDSPLIERSESGIQRGKTVIPISINVTRYNDNELLITEYLKLRVYKNGSAVTAKRNTSSLGESNEGLFASGTWYKIPVNESGIYELNTEYLEELGLNPSTIDPNFIQVWTTEGYPLPESNSVTRPQLTQVPILVQGENDGSLDEQDRIFFYGNSPNETSRQNGEYSHLVHPYSNYNYVFLTIGNVQGLRLTDNSIIGNPDRIVDSFRDFIWIEEELTKAEERIKSGRNWLGKQFPASSDGVFQEIFTDTLPGLSSTEAIEISGKFVNRSTSSVSFSIRMNGSNIQSLFIPASGSYTSSEGRAGISSSFNTSVSAPSNTNILNFEAAYDNNDSGSTGFFDWLRITATRSLEANEGRLLFNSPEDGTINEVAEYRLSGFNKMPLVLEISNPTDPKMINTSEQNNDYSFRYFSGVDLKFIVQDNFMNPEPGSVIPNQDLKGITFFPEYVIVTAEDFLNQARELSEYREQEDGLTSIVVTQNKIVNEFSGGVNDPAAIRDYLKFLYDRALSNGQEPPKYALLFGDTTFDYKGIIDGGHTNYVMTYQSDESLHRTESYASDDFFGFLDDVEGEMDVNGSGVTPSNYLLDIGVGRIPAQTQSEATVAVQKIKIYENPNTHGNWQNQFTFAADDDFPNVELNRDLHVLNADETANLMNIYESGVRLNKIYQFAYNEEITGGGRRIPGASQAFINAFNQGTLVMNYSGHGNEQTLSDEQLFVAESIPNLTNSNKLAVLVTATCQFGRYDDIDAQSGAEQLLFADNGGVISAFTTTRVVYTGAGISSRNNFGLNVVLSQKMVERDQNNTALRFGDIFMNTKNTLLNGSPIITSRNSKKFIFLGDPAGKFQLPVQKTQITSINSYTESGQDTVITIKGLDTVTLNGQITDISGNFLGNFSGQANITVYDAERSVPLPSDREWVQENRCFLDNCNYTVEKDVLFKGKAAVDNGQFTSTFVVPRDISFSDSTGRIVVYAEDERLTANGSFTKLRFNGINENAVNDGRGPQMDIYLNDDRFVNGSLVNDSPNLIIDLEDPSGINTTGTGVGHEIIATINTQPEQTFVLNDFYEGDIDNFTKGRIEYPLDDLPDGSYSLKVRAWDVHNNPSEKEAFFEVASQDQLEIRNVFNYPNPMNNVTRFSFEHNQPGSPLDVSVQIYTLSGRPVQQLQNQLITNSSYASITWNGRDRDHDRLGNGTYIYVLRVTADTPNGRQRAEKIEKLVIIR